MPHPDEGLIHAWLDGELDPADSARVEALVASDPEWRAAVAEARGLIAASSRVVSALDRVPANVVPRAPARTNARGRNWWLTRVAALLLVVAGASIVWQRDPMVRSVDGNREAAPSASVEAHSAAAPKPELNPEQKPAPAVEPTRRMKDRVAKDAVKAAPEITAPSLVTSAASPAAPIVENRASDKSDTPAREALAAKKTPAESGAGIRALPQARTLASGAPTAAVAFGVARAKEMDATRRDAEKSATIVRCYVPRGVSADSATVIRLDARALDDSVRGGWVIVSDSLVMRPTSRVPLQRVTCPAVP